MAALVRPRLVAARCAHEFTDVDVMAAPNAYRLPIEGPIAWFKRFTRKASSADAPIGDTPRTMGHVSDLYRRELAGRRTHGAGHWAWRSGRRD